jgi:hypothetical protein
VLFIVFILLFIIKMIQIAFFLIFVVLRYATKDIFNLLALACIYFNLQTVTILGPHFFKTVNYTY